MSWSGGWREGQEDIGPIERIDGSGDCQRGMFLSCGQCNVRVFWQPCRVINMFYAPFVRMFNVFMCSFGLLAFHVFLCVFHVSACKHVRLTCAQ